MRLQGKLLLAIVPAIAVSLATLGFAMYGKLSAGIASEQLARIDIAMERVQATARAYVDMNEVNASLFGDAEPIVQYFRDVSGSSGRGERTADPVRSLFERMQRRVPDFRELRLLSRDGRELIRVAEAGLVNRSRNEADAAWFRQVGLNWGLAVHTNVVPHPDDGSLVLMIARPIELADPADGDARPQRRLHGYLVIAAGLDFLRREGSNESFGESSRILVLDRMGRAVFDAHGGTGASSERVALSRLERELAGPGASADPARIAIDERWYTVAQRPLFDTMTIAAIVPDAASDRLATGVARSVALVTALSILVAVTLFYVLLRILLIVPIRGLGHSAMAIERGERGGLLSSSRRQDEIGELAAAFHRMHQRLSESIEAVRASHERTERLAFEDRLTGLFNRLWFMTRLEERVATEIPHAARADRFAMLLIDLDGFRRFNDRFGLAVGDALLCEIADRLSRCVTDDRDGVVPCGAGIPAPPNPMALARLGSDEFVISFDDIERATEVVQRIADALSAPVPLSGQTHLTRANIGMAVYPDDATAVHDLLRCADLALCAAKGGTSGFQRYDRSIRDGIEHRRRLELDLKGAVASASLTLQYQPQINVASGRIQGVEALLRWEHAQFGFVSPEVFVSIAEDNGTIVDIGRRVLHDACDQWLRWHEEGIAPERISINVSPRQFRLGDVVAEVREALAHRRMPAACLEVELTESGVADADDDLVGALSELRRLGVRVALDDFGKGISTLGALAALPIDTLKIDRSFVTGVDRHSRTEKVLAATLAMIASLDLEGVAEGVETEAEFRWLQAHGCAIVQGYHFSRPLWSPDMTELLRTQRERDEQRAA